MGAEGERPEQPRMSVLAAQQQQHRIRLIFLATLHPLASGLIIVPISVVSQISTTATTYTQVVMMKTQIQQKMQ